MTQPREEWTLDTKRLGRRVLVFDSLPSTNDFAAKLARDSANDGVAVITDMQTAGRGQHGRTWTAAPGSGVLMSLLLFPPEQLRRPAILTAWAAIAVCRTIQKMIGISARIKWPNDVLVHGKKVCGILIEQGRGTVVGVGLNVSQTAADFVGADLPKAASLGQFVSSAPNTSDVARELLRQLDDEFDSLLAGKVAALEASWQWHLGLLGRQVSLECHSGVIAGLLSRLSFEAVAIERKEEPSVSLPPEKVLHITASESEPEA